MSAAASPSMATALLTVTDSVISGNTASGGGQGGGIYNDGTRRTSSTPPSPGTRTPRGGQGGGIYNDGTVTVTNSTILRRTPPRAAARAPASITTARPPSPTPRCRETRLRVVARAAASTTAARPPSPTPPSRTTPLPGPGAGQGGGIYNSSAATIADSTISGNAAPMAARVAVSTPDPATSCSFCSRRRRRARISNAQQCLNCGLQAAQSAVLAADIVATPGGAPAGGECAGGHSPTRATTWTTTAPAVCPTERQRLCRPSTVFWDRWPTTAARLTRSLCFPAPWQHPIRHRRSSRPASRPRD